MSNIIKQRDDINAQFAETYVNEPKLSPLVREINWTNNLLLLSRTRNFCKEIEVSQQSEED